MAVKVSVHEDEYTSLKNQLESVHESILEEMKRVLDKLEALNSTEGGFYTKSVTPKVNLVCGEIKDVLSTLREIYTTHETIVNSFKTAIADLDTSC